MFRFLKSVSIVALLTLGAAGSASAFVDDTWPTADNPDPVRPHVAQFDQRGYPYDPEPRWTPDWAPSWNERRL